MVADFLGLIEANALEFAASAAIVLLSAIVRGYSGFGFSLLTITAMSLLMPVALVIPTIFILEIAASINLIPAIWRDIHWRSLAWLLGGYVLGMPLGIKALANLPAPPMQIALGILVIGVAVMMLRGFHLTRTPGRAPTTATGMLSGILNGAFGIGGPPVILFYFSTPEAAAMGRASIIFFFLACDLIGLGFLAEEGLVTFRSLVQFVIWLPALLIGIALGARAFRNTDPAAFRRIVLLILIGLAGLAIAKAAGEMI